MTLVRNETQRHSAALKIAGQNPVVPTPSMRRFDTERVPPNDAMSRFVGFGDKSWDNLKTFFKLRALSFCFCPKVRGGSPLEARWRRKRPF